MDGSSYCIIFCCIDCRYTYLIYDFVGIFVIAALSGLVSFIPGGFGAFDLVVLLGLKSLGISEEKILLALVLYRFAYYFVPVMIALILSSFEFGNTAKNISTIRSTLYL